MRNTTKLKLILTKFSLCLDMNDEGMITITMVDKANNMHTIDCKNYTSGIAKAYSIYLKYKKGK